MIDRYEFYERYGIRPTAVDSLGIGETYTDEKKGLFFEVKDFTKNKDTGFKDSVTFFDGKEVIAVDLSAHWEKRPRGRYQIQPRRGYEFDPCRICKSRGRL